MIERPAWHERAACRGKGADLFIGAQRDIVASARRYCPTCVVASSCRAEGENQTTTVAGVWGGMIRTGSGEFVAPPEPATRVRVRTTTTAAPAPAHTAPPAAPAPRSGTPSSRKIPVDAIEHGTRRGHQQHARNADPPCDACLEANAAYYREHRAS